MTPLTFILIGHPVSHSVSPAIHGAVYRHHRLPHRYELVDCPDTESVKAQVERVRNADVAGANVTVPHKRLALDLADEVDGSAARTGAANVLLRSEAGQVVAYNTDVGALADLLQAGARRALGERTGGPGEKVAVVLGNGGAALAAVVACMTAGADTVYVSARSWNVEAERDSWKHREQFEGLGAKPLSWGSGADRELQRQCRSAQLLVQATSAGMVGKGGGEALAALVPWDRLRSDVFVYDVVYNPPMTPFLERADALGLANEGGLSMLVGQAALAVELWLSLDAPRVAMRVAAENALFGVKK